MDNVTSVDDKKKKKLKPTKRSIVGGNILPEVSAAERNRSLGYDPQIDRDAAEGALDKLLEGMDIGELNQQGTNNQREVLIQVRDEFKAGNYFNALARIIREDIQLTNRTLWMFLRLNRVYQGQRTGTTDVEEMPEAKNLLLEENEDQKLLGYYSGPDKNRPAVAMALRAVAAGRSGTTAVGLDDLELTHQMVRNALKAELKDKFEDVVSFSGPQHGLSGLEMPGVKNMDPLRGSFSNDESLNKYLRLYEVLTIELLDKQTQTLEKDMDGKFKKAQTFEALNKLGRNEGVVITPEMSGQFKTKIAGMRPNELEFFNLKIAQILLELKQAGNAAGEAEKSVNKANVEIQKWLDPRVKFDDRELRRDINKTKTENEEKRARELEVLRGNLKAPIQTPVRNPVKPEDLKRAA